MVLYRGLPRFKVIVDFRLRAHDFRFSSLWYQRGASQGQRPRFKIKYGKFQPLHALCFPLWRYRRNRLPLHNSEGTAPHAPTRPMRIWAANAACLLASSMISSVLLLYHPSCLVLAAALAPPPPPPPKSPPHLSFPHLTPLLLEVPLPPARAWLPEVAPPLVPP